MGTPDISVNIAFSYIAYFYTLKMEEARSSETPTRRTKLHGVTPQNIVIFIYGTPYKLSVLMQDEIHRGQKNADKTKQCVKEDKYLHYFVAFCQSVTSMRLTKH